MIRAGFPIVAFLVWLALLAPAAADGSPSALLNEMKIAAGGAKWDSVKTISADGSKASFGLNGKYESIEDVCSGWFKRGADYGLLANAEGLDRLGRWRMDNSRQVHPLNSPEARAVAVTEAYLAQRGYFFPARSPAHLELLDPASENGDTFDRIEATPNGGRALTLWIRRKDHLLDRAVMRLDTVVRTVRYRDYRETDGLMLPFEIDIDNGDQPETGAAKINAYRIDAPTRAEALRRPPLDVTDAGFLPGKEMAQAPLMLDPMSGFPLVWASVDGKGPFPFILDTGGHDILTPAAAAKLRLSVTGNGISLGAGAGSTPTKFTAVGKLTIGDAELRGTPFTVLELDLGETRARGGKAEPVFGIIGLELFERFGATLDYRAHELTLRPLGMLKEGAAGAVPIRFTRDMPLVHASLEGKDGWFGIDSGNNTDVIVFSVWAKNNGLAERLAKNDAVNGASVGGSLQFREGRAGSLVIGAERITDLKVLLAGENMGSLSSQFEAGNIGESVLSHYRVTFDYQSGLMRLERQ